MFKYYDDGYNPVNSVQLTRKLVQEDKVFAVVGSLGTEVNQAMQPYLNSAKVPHVLVSTGASDFGKDYKKYPWTIGWQPDYVSEGRLYGTRHRQNKPNAKIAILYQNDSYGKDYLNGFKSALGSAKAEAADRRRRGVRGDGPSPPSQLARLRASGADTLIIFVTPTTDDPDVRDHPGARLEADANLRQLGLRDRRVHDDRRRLLERSHGERLDQRGRI